MSAEYGPREKDTFDKIKRDLRKAEHATVEAVKEFAPTNPREVYDYVNNHRTIKGMPREYATIAFWNLVEREEIYLDVKFVVHESNPDLVAA